MMKRINVKIILLFAVLCTLGLAGCSTLYPEETEKIASLTDQVQFDGTMFSFNGNEYDIADINENVNSINDCFEIGQHIIIEGHIGPYNHVYLVFNAETATFEKVLDGNNLIWQGDNIQTILYTFWNCIYDYEGNVVATISMPETSYVDKISFSDDLNAIEVTIANADGSTCSETYTIERSVKMNR